MIQRSTPRSCGVKSTCICGPHRKWSRHFYRAMWGGKLVYFFVKITLVMYPKANYLYNLFTNVLCAYQYLSLRQMTRVDCFLATEGRDTCPKGSHQPPPVFFPGWIPSISHTHGFYVGTAFIALGGFSGFVLLLWYFLSWSSSHGFDQAGQPVLLCYLVRGSF